MTVKAAHDISRNAHIMGDITGSRSLTLKSQGTSRKKRNINFANLISHPTQQPLEVKFEVL
jgi:hypothetical protein